MPQQEPPTPPPIHGRSSHAVGHENVDIPILVKAVRQETPGHLSLVFARPRGFEYEPGDWIDLGFDRELSGGRTYSFSSGPTEPDLVITFKEGQSGVKRTLQSASTGDLFRITAYGNDYEFSLRPHRNSVLIAAGVGVAPFRSMIATMADRSSADAAHLIYLNRTADFLFREEFDSWQRQLPAVTIDFVVTQGLKSKERRRLLAGCVDNSAHYYYIAGPPAMIESTEVVLMDAGVDHGDIRIDSFDGY